jgi:hypothetical protein
MPRGTNCRKSRKELRFDIELHTERFAGFVESARTTLSRPLTAAEGVNLVETLKRWECRRV